MVQEVRFAMLQDLGVTLIAADSWLRHAERSALFGFRNRLDARGDVAFDHHPRARVRTMACPPAIPPPRRPRAPETG